MPIVEALAELQELALSPVAAAVDLAHHSLEIAPADALTAARLLQLARSLHQAAGAAPTADPWLRYAQARLDVLAGDLARAEINLLAARQQWADLGEALLYARSGLGLTQVLAMQGRFDAAESVIRAAIDAFATVAAPDFEATLTLVSAHQNLATLLSYQERYVEALDLLQVQRVRVEQMLAVADDSDAQKTLSGLLGELCTDTAVYQSYLDQPQAAQHTLRAAIELFTAADMTYLRGCAHTNLGHLYTRMGWYADALREFDAAQLDILGTHDPDRAPERWQAADMLFLEQAIAHLSLNLLAEAAADLDRAIALFEQSGQRYELGQAIYYRALIVLYENDIDQARQWLDRAEAIFAELDNPYWRNRVQLAGAHAAYAAGVEPDATAMLDHLLAGAASRDPADVLSWDLPLRCEAVLLALRLALRRGDVETAQRLVEQAAGWLATLDDAALLYPELAWRVIHAQGLTARAQGDADAARAFFQAAVEAVERQRATLPVEDFRTAFLVDKTTVYTDLVLSLLDAPPTTPDSLATAFAVIERARSRALLERLLAAVEQNAPTQKVADAETGAAVRSQLTWLYNQLLGGLPDSRYTSQNVTEQIRACEASLQRVEWRLAPELAEADPATLGALQAALTPAEQAIVYYRAGDEWMAFVVAADEAHLVRHLCRAEEVEKTLAELRFQLGRVEVGGEHIERHADRLLRGVRAALHGLYALLLAPLASHLTGERLLFIPYGELHLMPFHAAWDGAHYLLEGFEVCYAPSVSVELVRRQRESGKAFGSLAAFALREPSIPQAEAEVYAAARHFQMVQLCIDAAAQIDALHNAAATCDVLHFATHGLFRPDNPFFSALKLADGWVDVRTIYRLPLRARLVVLSACESGAVRVQGADEAIGLVRGFLGAGAQSLIVSLWNVHDASAAQLMTEFYSHLIEGGLTPTQALCATQRRAIGEQRHPYFWAPYAAIG